MTRSHATGRQGSPTLREYVLAIVLVLGIAAVAIVVIGGQTAQILSQSHAI